MDPSLALAGSSAAESLIGNISNIFIAKRQRKWQEEMVNTSVQRRKQDMIKAGINPILGMNMTGASAPPGASANIQPSNATQTYLQAKMNQAQIKTAEADLGVKDSQRTLNTIQAGKTAMDGATAAAMANYYNALTDVTNTDRVIKLLSIPQHKAAAAMYETAIGKQLPWIQSMGPALMPLLVGAGAGKLLKDASTKWLKNTGSVPTPAGGVTGFTPVKLPKANYKRPKNSRFKKKGNRP